MAFIPLRDFVTQSKLPAPAVLWLLLSGKVPMRCGDPATNAGGRNSGHSTVGTEISIEVGEIDQELLMTAWKQQESSQLLRPFAEEIVSEVWREFSTILEKQLGK